jgi:hypothetical protein
MFMGVSELHKLGYIHRDLKPEVGRVAWYGSQQSRRIFGADKMADAVIELLGRFYGTCQVDRFRIGYWSPKPGQDRVDEEQG